MGGHELKHRSLHVAKALGRSKARERTDPVRQIALATGELSGKRRSTQTPPRRKLAPLAPPSGSLFAHGSTTVTCSATNAAGITASGAFAVHVVDGTAPVIHSISDTPSELWPPNGQYAAVVVTVNATDDADATLDAQIVNIQTSETVTADDWRITGALTADLRAERNGKERPRIYTLVAAVADDAGNVAPATVTVTVPHEKAEAPASTTRRRSMRR